MSPQAQEPDGRYRSTLDKIKELYDVDLNAPSPITLHHTTRTSLATLFHTLGYTRGAEIGVGSGVYSEILCQQIPGLKLYGVDAWKVYPGIIDFDSDDYLEEDRQKAIKRLDGYDVELMQMMSIEAAKLFSKHYLDFVYIDANHWNPYANDDIKIWSKKVRPGGIVSGHDYHREHPHVIDAVKKYANVPYFIVGDTGLADYPDNIPSWFWVAR